ncbi:hypothetical protein CR513_28146, partial [Mucuna pruriens]
ETNSANEDQKQAKVESVLDNQAQNRVPSGSNSSARNSAESDSNPTRADSISINMSQPQQKKAEIMSAHLVPNPIQFGQLDPKIINDNSSSPPPPMELKPLPSHLKYAYLDTEQQLLAHKTIAKTTESDHPRRGQERGDKTACHKNHLPISDSR